MDKKSGKNNNNNTIVFFIYKILINNIGSKSCGASKVSIIWGFCIRKCLIDNNCLITDLL